MNKIKVVDSPCGSGKTSFAIQMMNEHPERAYVFCTPFLDEIERIKKSCVNKIEQPGYVRGRKVHGFNDLLMEGQNIAVSHATFSNATEETKEYIRTGHYTLILDEVLDVLINYNDACGDTLNKGDLKILREKFISVDDYGKVHWIAGTYPESKYSKVERLAKSGNLYCLDDTLLVWEFPAEIFSLFDEVFVLTYLFKGSFLKPFFEYHNIQFDTYSIKQDHEDRYYIVKWCNDLSSRDKYKDLITILDNPKLNNYKNAALSKTWFHRNSNKAAIKQLQKNLFNYFHNVTKAKAKDILWTCPKEYQKKLSGKGYTANHRITAEERKQLSSKELAELEKKSKCFISLNSRATNDYSDRTILAYVFNFFANPFVKRYFQNKNIKDGTNIHVDEDYLALSCLIQWIFRSGIRKGEPIQIYIPSTRMRTLLMKWLDGEM